MVESGEGGVGEASFARGDDAVKPVLAQLGRLG